MKTTSIRFIWALIFCLPLQIFGQKTTRSNEYLVKTYTFYKNTDPSLNHQNYFDVMAEKMLLSAESKMVLTEELPGKNGYSHFKYQQFQAGLPIFGSRYILHEKEGKVVTATGRYSPQVNTAAAPAINAATATAFAKQAMKATEYDNRMPQPILCFIDPAFPNVSETLRLAYQVDLHSTEPFDKRRYFVDATSGNIITQFPLILEEGVPSTAKTKYYGVQNIITDSVAPQEYVLRDLTRGQGIFVSDINENNFTNTSSTWDLTNDQMDEVALDAHYCTQEYFDMMQSDFNWQGQDGNGKALRVHIHAGDFVNAYWDGESSNYGDGDCNYGPLTTLEVVGHEFTHGMIDYTSRLVYDLESGAINESLADMFGKMLERKTDPANFSWSLGHSFALGPNSEPFRVLDDPNSVEMPAYYKGLYWEDFNDVHTNSSIGNLWFTMLVDGKQGINELGISFDVPAIGIDKAGQIVFQVNKNYFTEGSNYNEFYQFSVEVAESLYGTGSMEMQAVMEAWKAVGLPSVLPSAFDLSISGDASFDNNFCGLNQYLPVIFKIKNTSNVAYNPSMMATVTLSNFPLQDYTVNLTSPIGPGEVFEIQVNDWLEATEPGYIFLEGTLNLMDDNPNNNISFSFYQISEFESDDLSLFIDLALRECFDTALSVGVFVDNNSCEAVPSGTVLHFTATDELGNLVWTSPPYSLVDDLIGFSSVFTQFDMPNINAALTFNLVYSNDPEPSNNEYIYGSVAGKLPITSNYFNNFEMDLSQDDYLELTNYSFPATILFQNSHYFATTGDYQNPDDFQRCADVFSVFNNDFAIGINASIHSCIDFSSSPAPALEFDLAQFRNVYTDTSNFQHSSMLQVKWSGNQSGSQIIFGQAEGLVKHYNFPLPPFFKGELDFKLYTELGVSTLEPNLLSEYDFVLLDNLKLSVPTSGTEEATTGSVIIVSPNPARDIVSIQATDGIKTILLQNVNGQTLQSLQVNTNTYELDLHGLANGFYLLNIQLSNGEWGLKKLVKMD